jgi:hypothetical protein
LEGPSPRSIVHLLFVRISIAWGDSYFVVVQDEQNFIALVDRTKKGVQLLHFGWWNAESGSLMIARQ